MTELKTCPFCIGKLEQALDICLAVRDEFDRGEHPDVSDPDWSLGAAFAANLIAHRIGSKL